MFLNCTIGIFNQTVGQPGERAYATTIRNPLPQEICKPPTETVKIDWKSPFPEHRVWDPQPFLP